MNNTQIFKGSKVMNLKDNNTGYVSHINNCDLTGSLEIKVAYEADNHHKFETLSNLLVIVGFRCPECGGVSSTSFCCENPSCPNMPCCGEPRDKCDCYVNFK